ncbi:MAG: biopolymer transporter ExbD [Halieaceae bacterium]|nr:biopolymer transporter ExbD [Halieaceae bacterium]
MIKLEASNSTAKRIDDRIIPMINIIFLLLMFFLIVGNISELVDEDVVPPRSSSNTVTASVGTEWLLTRDGVVMLDGQALGLSQLAAQLEAAGALPERITLRADGNAHSGALLPLLDLLRSHGVEKIALVTINEDGGS